MRKERKNKWKSLTSGMLMGTMIFSLMLPVTTVRAATKMPVNQEKVKEAGSDVAISETTFPDAVFRDWIKSHVTGAGDGVLTQEEIANVTVIACSNQGITDFTGLNIFKNLTELYTTGNKITSKTLNLSQLTKLEIVYIDSCNLDSVDFGDNTALGYIQCQSNNLTSLDVSKNKGLTQIMCNNNKIESLDLSQNTKMKRIDCYTNGMKTLNFGACKEYKSVWCGDNQLEKLDVSQLENLEDLWCYKNKIDLLNLSKATNLLSVICWNNWNLHTLDLSNSPLLELASVGYSGFVSIKINEKAPLGGRAGQDEYLDGNRVNVLATPTSANGDYEYDLAKIDPKIDGSKITISAADKEKGISLSGTTIKGLTLGEAVTYDYKFAEGKAITVKVTPLKSSPGWNYFTTPLSIKGWEEGQTPNKPEAASDKGTVTFTYSDKKDGTYGPLPSNPHSGTWYVKATVEKTDEYIGLSEIKAFTITSKAAVAVKKVSISKSKTSKIKATIYSGYAKKPSVTVTYNGKKLKKGTDYTITYQRNVKVGTAKIVIKGKGKYTGTKTITFKIKKRKTYANGWYTVKTKALKGHTGPSPSKPIKVYYKKGDKVQIIKLYKKTKKHIWAKVKKGGKTSYVYAKYLKL